MSLLSRRSLAFLAALILSLAPARADDKIDVSDVFSYQLPPGWAQVQLPGSSYPAAIETANPAKCLITVNADIAQGDLGNWCAASLARNKTQLASLGARVGVLEAFTTTAGLTGYRAPIDLTARGKPIHYFMYFFDGGSGTKLAITCACPAAEVAHYAPIFESAMKTFAPR